MNMDASSLKEIFKKYIYIYDQIDTDAAAQRIKNNIWFKGPNAWILAFSVVIASVGLNVNSTAVIIGAMLISPLMGPIIGAGLAMGTNDIDLLKQAGRNLLVMVVISLAASMLFFILSPLSLLNPTELEARTSPTIYDVLIALFGGFAGILENSRKEQGTAIAGVAIATALMPPLCTAGYGLARGDMHFFVGALYLFIINSVFIALATYIMVKYLRFKTVTGSDPLVARKRRNWISAGLAVVVIPSIISAVGLILDNNYERNVRNLVEGSRRFVGRSYIYDYKVKKRKVTLEVAGEPLTDSLKADFFAKAAAYKVSPKSITLREHHLGVPQEELNRMIKDIYARNEAEQAENLALIRDMALRIDALSARLDSLLHPADSLLPPPAGQP